MSNKIGYLTIDDSPSGSMEKKTNILFENDIPAVFFCSGVHLEENPEAVVRAIKKGYIIANHAYNHPHFSDISLKECLDQIKKTDELVEKIYERAGTGIPGKFFRFPFGDKGGLNYADYLKPLSEEGLMRKNAIQDLLKKLGYFQPEFRGVTYHYYRDAGLLKDIDWYWTFDLMEWSTFIEKPVQGLDSEEKVIERMDRYFSEGKSEPPPPDSEEIILIHDHPETDDFFNRLIRHLLTKNITFRMPDF